MAKTLSKMVGLGTKMPSFELKDARNGKIISNKEDGRVKVVAFMCNHCPYVKHILNGWSDFTKSVNTSDVEIISINSNDAVSYPEDNPEEMLKLQNEQNWDFPYLFDESQDVAKAFDAACTPDFFVYSKNLELLYRGQFDASRPGNQISVTGQDLRSALESILHNQPITFEQQPSMGCNIKWKK